MIQLYPLRACILAAYILLSAFPVSLHSKVLANDGRSQQAAPQLPGGTGAWEVEVQQTGGMIYRVEGALRKWAGL